MNPMLGLSWLMFMSSTTVRFCQHYFAEVMPTMRKYRKMLFGSALWKS
jgi:hypothetical protein